MLRIVPTFRERQHLERAVDVRRDAQRAHQQHARSLGVFGEERAGIEREVAGHAQMCSARPERGERRLLRRFGQRRVRVHRDADVLRRRRDTRRPAPPRRSAPTRSVRSCARRAARRSSRRRRTSRTRRLSPIERARPLAEKGNLPVRYSRPLSFTWRSVSPTDAISGHV